MATEYGVQGDGTFDRKPIDVIREEVTEDFTDELGQDLELRPSSPETQIINAVTLELAKQWAALEQTYFAGFFEDSFGEQLDKQLALAGFRRRSLRGATGEVTLSRADPAPQDVQIAEGTVVQAPATETRPAIPFEITSTVTLFEGNTELTAVPIEALEPWDAEVSEEWLGEATNLPADSITQFKNPFSGIDNVTNPQPTGDTSLDFTEGRDRETDAEFKNRYLASFAQAGDATRDAVKGRVLNADEGISSVTVEEIHDDANGDFGPEVTVLAPGVDPDIIAQAIYDSRAAGLESFGTESGTAIDDDGDTFTENFNYADKIDVAVEITVTTDSGTPLSPAEQEETKDRIIRYIGGETSSGVSYPGLEIGESVIYDQVFRRVMAEENIQEIDLALGEVGGTLDTDNISIGAEQAAQTTLADITFL